MVAGTGPGATVASTACPPPGARSKSTARDGEIHIFQVATMRRQDERFDELAAVARGLGFGPRARRDEGQHLTRSHPQQLVDKDLQLQFYCCVQLVPILLATSSCSASSSAV